MKKKSNNNIMTFLLIIGIIVSIFIFTLIVLFMKNIRDTPKNQEEELRIRQEESRQEVESYLEKKYGKKFIINSKWIGTSGGSIIPALVDDSPIYCEVYAEYEPDFGFRVYKSQKDSSINRFRDGYCWVFFREQIREYFKDRMDGMISQEYKLVVNIYPDTTFDNNIQPDSTMKSYFKYADRKIDLHIYLIVNNKNDEKILENRLYQILKEFYEKYDENMYIYFMCFKTESQEDFDFLDEKKKENTVFVKPSDSPSTMNNSWGINLENLFIIEDFDYKRTEG